MPYGSGSKIGPVRERERENEGLKKEIKAVKGEG